jgi:hypothetical protein
VSSVWLNTNHNPSSATASVWRAATYAAGTDCLNCHGRGAVGGSAATPRGLPASKRIECSCICSKWLIWCIVKNNDTAVAD